MDRKTALEEKALKLVNGGVLQEGWEESVLSLMALYKGKFGDSGKDMVLELFIIDGVDNSPLDTNDIITVIAFI